MSYILALDQGTTSSRAILFASDGKIIGLEQQEFPQLYPKPGWVEHNPEDIWWTQRETATKVLTDCQISAYQVRAIGVSNQRETTVVWDRKTGKAIHNAIVWQDRRTSDTCDELKIMGKENIIREKTGLVVDAYFSATKIKWILDNVPGARARAYAGDLCFGTIDSWIIWNLTGGSVHATDVSNASRTMLFNIHSLDWDEDLLGLLEIPRSMLPEVRASSGEFGGAKKDIFGSEIPICGVAGDQQAALFGQMCFEPGSAKNTYGTGAFMMVNTGDTPIESKHRLLTTIAWDLGDETVYALEGSVFIAGAVVHWLRDGLEIIKSSKEIEQLAESVVDNGGVYVVPAFVGLGAPHWDQSARGAIVGLTRGSNKGHIARAALESIAFQVRDVLEVIKEDITSPISELKVDGGASVNDLLLQFQSDILGINLVRPTSVETTALGVAYLAGLAVGVWNSKEELKSLYRTERVFSPEIHSDEIGILIDRWDRARERSRNWTVD